MDGTCFLNPEWRALYCDNKALEMNDRQMLKKSIEAIIADLNKRYVDDTSPVFPNESEHAALYKRCIALAELLGLKNPTKYGGFLIAIKRIENRLKINILSFYEAMVTKLSKLDVPPQTHLYNAIERCEQKTPMEVDTLKFIYCFLGSKKWEHPLNSQPWSKWLDTMKRVGLGVGVSVTCPQVEFDAVEKSHKDVFAYFIFMGLQRQQILWMSKYSDSTYPTIRYISLLARPKDKERLRRVFHPSNSAVDDLGALLEKDAARCRRNKSYRKLHSHPRNTQDNKSLTSKHAD